MRLAALTLALAACASGADAARRLPRFEARPSDVVLRDNGVALREGDEAIACPDDLNDRFGSDDHELACVRHAGGALTQALSAYEADLEADGYAVSASPQPGQGSTLCREGRIVTLRPAAGLGLADDVEGPDAEGPEGADVLAFSFSEPSGECP